MSKEPMLEPASQPIPFDILTSILDSSDFETLKVLSLTSKEVNMEANRLLFKSYTVATKTPPSRVVARNRVRQGIDGP